MTPTTAAIASNDVAPHDAGVASAMIGAVFERGPLPEPVAA